MFAISQSSCWKVKAHQVLQHNLTNCEKMELLARQFSTVNWLLNLSLPILVFCLCQFIEYKWYTARYLQGIVYSEAWSGGYKKDIFCILILGMCSDVAPLDKVKTNAFTHKNTYPCQPCSHIYLFAAVDLGMTLLPGKLLFLCPSFFFCWLFVRWFSISVSFIPWCVERGEKYASSSVYPAIDLAIG